MQKYVEDMNGALRVLSINQEIGNMDIEEVLSKGLPDDIGKARDGFYISASNPSVVYVNPYEILEALGEEPSFDMVGQLTASLQDAYKKDGIEIVVVGNE